MLMPETAVNKYHSEVLRENDIRPPLQITAVQTEAQTCAVQAATKHALGKRVRASYARHMAASLSDREPVCHQPR
jgi:hypothetical protein